MACGNIGIMMEKKKRKSVVDDKRSGKSMTWFSDGKQKIASNYIAGNLDGEFLEWDKMVKKYLKAITKIRKNGAGFWR